MVKLYKVIFGWFLSVVYEIGANLYGSVQHPFLTWKRILKQGRWYVSLFLLFIFSGYFSFREPIRWGNIRWNGIYIEQLSSYKVRFWAEVTGTKVFAVIISYLFIVLLITLSSRLMVKFEVKKTLKQIFIVWIYSYFPTVLWFTLAAGLFIVLPPPRQSSYSGLFFSIVFLTCSAGLMGWKLLLYYYTMRLTVGLSNKKIIWASMIILPVILSFSQLMYWLGIFKLPFI